MRAAGMNATVSSIHINGWFGAHNKLEGAGGSCASCGAGIWRNDRWVYVGDSTNDQLMFQHFAHSVGVANGALCAAVKHLPRYVTQGERGAGFAELAGHPGKPLISAPQQSEGHASHVQKQAGTSPANRRKQLLIQ